MSGFFDTWQPFINSAGLLIFGAFLTFIATKYWNTKSEIKKTAEDLESQARRRAEALETANEKLLARVADLERQHAIIGQAILPINALVQAALIKELTHFHEPRTDQLLEKLGPPSTLTEDEMIELETRLEIRETVVDAEISPRERGAARILPEIIRRVREEEADAANSLVTMRVVTISIGGQTANLVPVKIETPTNATGAQAAVAEAHAEEQASIDDKAEGDAK